ncbi:MAG TPA: chromosome segregation protein SMC [Candidatus Binataceae bacterium]|nr:chromosome segregation protein SMC [Candidatus Binataceae bacterium]
MRLKSLDVVGFKSFLKPTVITFSPGLTAVVGPNGCGKSNVVDAIRWVLGEQAPTRLRGKSIEDLIFAGNDSNPAAGMAEVTLTLEAEDQKPLPEPYAELSEVAVARRVYRSGESEYLINRIPCRLKDIAEFFMAAQIHSRGYAIVEQGRIDEIIQAKPAELRTMVEEAAGLALFKGRREISERKLERTRENLARVADVQNEIERQLNYARRQAKQAAAYKLARAELDDLERLVAARRLLQQEAELTAHSARVAELSGRVEAQRTAIAAAQEAADRAGQELGAARAELATLAAELTNLKAATEERARTRTFLERRVADLGRLTPALEQSVAQLRHQLTMARAARAFAGARLAREKNQAQAATEEHLADLRGRHRAAEAAVRAAELAVEESKDDLAETLREVAVVRGRLGDLSGQRAEAQTRLGELAVEAPRLDELLEGRRAALAAAEAQCVVAADELARSEAVQRDSEARMLDLRAQLGQSALQLAACRQARDEAASRSRPLQPGSAADRLHRVLESLNGDGPSARPPMLLEVIKAPPALEPALRAVLGDQLDAVVTDSFTFALRAIDILKEKQGGRLSFISSVLGTTELHDQIEAPGIAGRLLDMVEVEPSFQGLAQALLGHVMLARDLSSASAAASRNGTGTVFVTPEGDLLAPARAVSGGSGGRSADAEALGMRERAAALDAATLVSATAEQAHEMLLRTEEWARLAAIDEIAALREARARLSTAERSRAEARAALGAIEQRAATVATDLGAARRRTEELSRQLEQANHRLEELAHAEQAKRARLAEQAAALADRRAEFGKLAQNVQEVAALIEARKAALAALEQELRHQRALVENLEAQIARAGEERDRALNERVEFERELAALHAQDRAAEHQGAELEAARERIATDLQKYQLEADRAGQKLKAETTELRALEAEFTDCRLQGERARTLAEELRRAFDETFRVNFDEVRADLEARLADRDADADTARLGELRAKVERIGQVNLAAEAEVAELEQRAAELSRERNDLQSAADDLAQTIQKLNREARRRFAETFEGAARNFAELFPKLMRGGKARLELSDAGDVLEAGVNIFVQPAGKKVKELALLSGGEKALSAMALIFSLFLLNPSPFCVMDEVDAPLDEFSLAAFTGLLRELKTASQFIVITHNQRTMQAADQIHGVTMERPGISRVISMAIPRAA